MEDQQFHARRAALYGYAATALQFPDDTTVADLTDDEVQSAIRAAGDAVGCREAVDRLIDALDGVDRDGLESAYNDLFGVPGDDGTYPVVPYEAEHTVEGDVGEKQRRIATVVGLLEQFGLEPGDEFDERHDHVAVELELLQVLSAQRAAALADGDDDAADRLARATATAVDEHLAGFVPELAHAVTTEVSGEAADPDVADDALGVYARAAKLAAALVERDAASHPDPTSTQGVATDA
ncbi:TorD/DmsD family molecular chaperone [Halomicrobium salinisoli]|uniref:TorD/DmsD family molecular chaperone n=1 Tax=Halomicrobium salinisoli TaxID=2878391 RepID=UPI001CF0CDEF|nr:molecular chaperone TorD family protein [Halomicrobium salinisoli]